MSRNHVKNNADSNLLNNRLYESDNKNLDQKLKDKNENHDYKTKSISDNLKSKKLKEILSLIFAGSLFGLSSVAYGSSSSLIVSYYESVYEKVCNGYLGLFKANSIKGYFKNVLFFLPFLFSFIAIFVLSYLVYAEIMKVGYGLAATFLFIGLNLFSIIFLFLIKSKLPNLPINRNQFSTYNKPKINWVIFASVFLGVFAISFIARYGWNSSNEFPTGLINYSQYLEIFPNSSGGNSFTNIYNQNTIQTEYVLQILFASLLCGFSTLIPFLSGSYFLNVLGVNNDINYAVQYAFGGYSPATGLEVNLNWAWSVTVISLIGVLCGIAASAYTVNYMIKKQREIFNTIVFAIASASFISIFVSLSNINYDVISKNSGLLTSCVLLFFFPIIPISGTIFWLQKIKKINFKFLSFIK